MDTVTHALLGTAIAQAGFRRKLGRKSLIAGAIFASLPDTDIFLSISSDPTAMIKYHRAATHSLILACLAAPLIGWLSWKICKKNGSWIMWSLLALTALFSHDILDLCTTWGTEILYPLTNTRYSLDALPIVDPLIILPLIAFLLSIFILKNLRLKRILAIAALVWCTIYTCTGLTFSHQALLLAESSRPNGFKITQEKAIPNVGTILLWHVVLKDESGNFFTTSVSSLKDKVFNEQYYKSVNNPRIEQILKSDKFEIFRRASSDLLLAQTLPENNEVTFIDMRYSMLDSKGSSIPIFFFNVLLDKTNNEVLSVERPLPDRSKVGGIKVYIDAIFN